MSNHRRANFSCAGRLRFRGFYTAPIVLTLLIGLMPLRAACAQPDVPGPDDPSERQDPSLFSETGMSFFEQVGGLDEQSSEWFACREAVDCILVPGLCGRQAAINREFKKQFADWRSLAKDEAQCLPPRLSAEAQVQSAPNCRNGQCIAVVEEQAASR